VLALLRSARRSGGFGFAEAFAVLASLRSAFARVASASLKPSRWWLQLR